MRRATLVVLIAALTVIAAGAMPSGAIPGAGGSMTVVSPNLDNGFPCQGGGDGGLTSIQNWMNNTPGLGASVCTGSIFSGSTANFIGSGTDANGTPYAVAGTGSLNGTYLYSEPCQTTPTGDTPVTGESYGAPGAPDANGGLNLVIPTAVGVVGQTPVTSALVKVAFWWSRVGVSAIVGIRNIRATFQPGNIEINDPAASGLAAAIFIPVNQPACGAPSHPSPGDINIFSQSLTMGTP